MIVSKMVDLAVGQPDTVMSWKGQMPATATGPGGRLGGPGSVDDAHQARLDEGRGSEIGSAFGKRRKATSMLVGGGGRGSMLCFWKHLI